MHILPLWQPTGVTGLWNTVIWHPLAALRSPKCCGGSTSHPRKTPIDPVRLTSKGHNFKQRASAEMVSGDKKTCTGSPPICQSTDLYGPPPPTPIKTRFFYLFIHFYFDGVGSWLQVCSVPFHCTGERRNSCPI